MFVVVGRRVWRRGSPFRIRKEGSTWSGVSIGVSLLRSSTFKVDSCVDQTLSHSTTIHRHGSEQRHLTAPPLTAADISLFKTVKLYVALIPVNALASLIGSISGRHRPSNIYDQLVATEQESKKYGPTDRRVVPGSTEDQQEQLLTNIRGYVSMVYMCNV